MPSTDWAAAKPMAKTSARTEDFIVMFCMCGDAMSATGLIR